MKLGQFQIYTGDGKGKTTAALGLALRACGAGLRVYLGQFLKEADTSELKALRRLPGIDAECYGSGLGLLLDRDAQDRDRACAEAGYDRLRKALTGGDYDVVIADEILCAMGCGLLDEDDLLSLVDQRPAGVELVFTGRGASEALLSRADLATEMRLVRHYYPEKRLPAREGIEW